LLYTHDASAATWTFNSSTGVDVATYGAYVFVLATVFNASNDARLQIEVSDDDFTDEVKFSETANKISDFIVMDDMNLSELIILIDQISSERNPYVESQNKNESIQTRKLPKQSMENNLEYGILLAGEQDNLTKIMLQLDQTIKSRN
ncbi:uncharacterized protein METZ01_LOCUS469434, partial [marine metagenome]